MILILKVEDAVFGARNVGVLFDDYIYQMSTGAFINYVLYNDAGVFAVDVDTALGGSDWRRLGKLLYYNSNVLQDNYEEEQSIIAKVYPKATPSPTAYSASDSNLVTSIKVNGLQYTLSDGRDKIGVSMFNNNRGSTLGTGNGNAPYMGSVNLGLASGSQHGVVSLSVPVFPTDCINENGEFIIPSDMNIVRTISVSIAGTNSGYRCTAYINESYIGNSVKAIFANGQKLYEPDDDPYSGDDGSDEPSGDDGGSGQNNWDDDSDDNDVPSLPSLSAVDTGFITLYNPSVSQLQSLASYMWGSLFDLDTFKRIFADPMDAILGLSIVPVNVPSGGAVSVKIGNIDTGVSLTKASSQYVEVDCGDVELEGKWKSYLDYNPYCKVTITLPYIGSYDLDIDQLRGEDENGVYKVGVKYHVDILSGACVAFVTVNGKVIAQYAGQCAISIPITSNNFSDTIQSISTLIGAGATMAITGGMSAPITAASIAGFVTASANTAANVASGKYSTLKSGNLSSSNGLLAIQKPYLLLERPKLCAPSRQNHYCGYPSYTTKSLGGLSGFTQVQDIRLNVPCTDTERNEIMNLLHSGVIL